jgi:hypothetical protein
MGVMDWMDLIADREKWRALVDEVIDPPEWSELGSVRKEIKSKITK